MVDWNFYKARRIKDVTTFLEKNECYDYEKFSELLKRKNIICPPKEEVGDIFPDKPAPPRRKPKSFKEKLGVNTKPKPKPTAKSTPRKQPAATTKKAKVVKDDEPKARKN